MTTRDVYTSSGDPIRIGILMDMPEYVADVGLSVYDVVRDLYQKSDRLDRPVEFLVKRPIGAPSGYIKNVTDAYHELCDEGALIVVGPNHADNNCAMTEHADARRVPVLALGATAQHLSEHVFSMSWSSIPIDATLCANWLVRQGCESVTVTYDRAHHAAEYVEAFRLVAARLELSIVAVERLPVIIGDGVALNRAVDKTLAAHRALKPDGIVHFGTGNAALPWARAVTESGWSVPRIMNDAFCLAYTPDFRSDFEGWVGTTLWDDENETLESFARSYASFHPGAPTPVMEMMALYRDAMTLALEGISLTSILTPAGAKEGLERVQMLPAASGGARTILSFGRYDHRAHKGADVMVLRRVKNGEVIMEGRYDPTVEA
jgi:branched-chain amino acid transport system substrate-binding protein